MLCLIYSFGNIKDVSLSIFLAIDIGIYILFNIFKEMVSGWSRFGCNIQIECIKYSQIKIV
jgi:hypothetical protein